MFTGEGQFVTVSWEECGEETHTVKCVRDSQLVRQRGVGSEKVYILLTKWRF